MARPELVNQRIGLEGATPLHLAVRRNDLELLRLLLSACPDLEIRDDAFRSTPLGWAKYLGRAEMIALLERYQMNSG
jgi:ankyrin repeat protein